MQSGLVNQIVTEDFHKFHYSFFLCKLQLSTQVFNFSTFFPVAFFSGCIIYSFGHMLFLNKLGRTLFLYTLSTFLYLFVKSHFYQCFYKDNALSDSVIFFETPFILFFYAMMCSIH